MCEITAEDQDVLDLCALIAAASQPDEDDDEDEDSASDDDSRPQDAGMPANGPAVNDVAGHGW